MRQFWQAVKEEYTDIFTDSGVMLIFLAGLAVYTMIYPIPYSREVLKELPVISIDQDHSALSRKLLRFIDATEDVRITEALDSLDSARHKILNAEAYGVVLIPRGFEQDVLRGRQAMISLHADACYFLIYRQIFTGVYKATATLSAGIEVRRLSAAGLGEKHALRARDPLAMDGRPLFNPAGGYATYVVPPVLILIMQQTLLIGIGMLGGTRGEENAKLPRSGRRVSILALLLGRGLVYFSIYILYPVFYLSMVYHSYALPRQAGVFAVLIFLTPYVLAVIYLGMALNTLFSSRELSIPVLIFTSMPMVFLIGFAWPLEAIPLWLRNVAQLIPSTPGCAGFIRLNQMGASLQEVRFEWFCLWGLCALYFALAWLSYYRRYQKMSSALASPAPSP